MDIQKLSAKYTVRKLNENDIDAVYQVMRENPLYFQYCPPMATHQSILGDMKALPPGTTYDDKYYMGFYEGDSLVAVMDLILNFPDRETAFVGFFMLSYGFQGKGLGTQIVKDCFGSLKECGYRYLRLGFVKGNPQSEAFWVKNGFVRNGIEDVQELYTVVVMQKEL